MAFFLDIDVVCGSKVEVIIGLLHRDLGGSVLRSNRDFSCPDALFADGSGVSADDKRSFTFGKSHDEVPVSHSVKGEGPLSGDDIDGLDVANRKLFVKGASVVDL